MQGAEQERQHDEVRDNPEPADRGEGEKPRRHVRAEQLVGEQHEVLPHRLAVELALARAPGAELVGQFADA